MNLQTAGRTDLDDYFKLSDIREKKKHVHNPFLVFVKSKSGIKVELVYCAKELLNYPPSTKIMVQWAGQYSSDFFQFTIGDLKKHIKINPPDEYNVF